MNGNDVTVLDTQVVSHYTVQTTAAIIELIVTEDNKHGVLSLFASNQDGIATEKLESVHSVVGQGDDGVVVINGISDPSCRQCLFQ